MLFLGIISWKGASRFNEGGGGCFSDWGASFLSGGVPWGDIGFDGRGFQKKSLDGGGGGVAPHYGKLCWYNLP